MALTFDAAGPSSAGAGNTGSATLNWTHTVGAGVTNGCIVVAVNFDTGGSGAYTMSATCAGSAMTSLGFIDTNGVTSGSVTAGWIQAWIATGVAAGANAIAITASGATPASLEGGSLSFSGYGGHGTPVLAAGSASPSDHVSGTATGVLATSIVAAFLAQGNGTTTQVAGTSQFVNSQGLVNSTGTASGATATGSGSVSATWGVGTTTDSWCTIAVEMQALLSVTTASLPGAAQGQAYSAALSASGGTGTGYTWSISSGSLPGWASLNSSTGVISGTAPGTPGVTAFTVEVTDSGSNTATQPLVLAVEVNLAASAAEPGWAIPGDFTPAAVPSGTPSTTADAGLAAGTGTAQQPVPVVTPRAGPPTATGTAQPPVATAAANAGLAAGTGTAQAPRS